jgi:hypothetical protein
VMGSLVNATALGCEAHCTATAGCVGFARKDAAEGTPCYFYDKAEVSGVFSHARPAVSWHQRPPVPMMKSDGGPAR